MDTALIRAIIAKRFDMIQNSINNPNLRERVWQTIKTLDSEAMHETEAALKGTDMWDYMYGDGRSEHQIMEYYDKVHDFCRAWEYVLGKIDALLKKYPGWDFDTVYESVHICDNCYKPVLQGYFAGEGKSGHFCSTECMLFYIPFSQYVLDYHNGVSYFSEWNIEDEALGILSPDLPYDQNGKPIRVGSIVQWNDPAIQDYDEGEYDHQISRKFEVWKIAGEIVHISDDFGDVEAYAEELSVIKY